MRKTEGELITAFKCGEHGIHDSQALTIVHIFVYNRDVKKIDAEKRLKKCGWWFERHGGNHDIWTNGEFRIPVPRHREVNERTAKGIIKEAKANKV